MSSENIRYQISRALNIDNKKLSLEEQRRMEQLVPRELMARMEKEDDNIYAIAGSYAAVICGINENLIYPGLEGNIFVVNSTPKFEFSFIREKFELWMRRIEADFMHDVMWNEEIYSGGSDGDDRMFKIYEVKKKLYHEVPVLFAMRIAMEIEVPSLQVVIYQQRTETGKSWRKLHFSDRDYRPIDELKERRLGYFLENPIHFFLHVRFRETFHATTIYNSAPRLDMLALNKLLLSGIYDGQK